MAEAQVQVEVEWLAIPRPTATTSHAFAKGAEQAVCDRVKLLDTHSPEHPTDRKCRICAKRLGVDDGY